MASSPHHIDFDEDELDESYDPDGEGDVFDNDFELSDSKYLNFQYTNMKQMGMQLSMLKKQAYIQHE